MNFVIVGIMYMAKFCKNRVLGCCLLFTGFVLFSSGCSFKDYSTAGNNQPVKANTLAQKLQRESIGGEAGKLIDTFMDQQLILYRNLEHMEARREAEGLHLTINSDLFFDASSHVLKKEGKSSCEKIFAVFKGQPDTQMYLEVHTDDIGSKYYNQALSERRAASIADYIGSLGTSKERLACRAFGEDQPKADNTFDQGRALNRRIEIGIYASSQLKEQAQSGKTL